MCIFATLKSPLVLYLRDLKLPKAVQIRRVHHIACLFHYVKRTEKKCVPILHAPKIYFTQISQNSQIRIGLDR